MSLFFRGNLYENTLYNRVVADFLTFLYRVKIELVYYIEIYWWKFILLVLLVLSLFACSPDDVYQYTKPLPHVLPDTCVVDSQCVNGHDYLVFYRSASSYNEPLHLEPFQLLHSPDCFCRFNRKFIVVKHSK